MAKLFNKIRQKLISEKPSFTRTTNYLKYAIGEIVLVVIGILIAISINNWNEKRKDKVRVKIAIQSIHQDIIKDSLLVSNYLPSVIKIYDHNRFLMEKAYKTTTNLDTLIKIMKVDFDIYWVKNFTFNHNTFDNLKSNGSFEILPDTLKTALSDLYTAEERSRFLIQETNIQYRNNLNEFLKSYNIIGRISNANYKNSYIYKNSWQNVNANHFTPLVASLLGSYNVLYGVTKESLEIIQRKIRTIIPLLKQ